MKLWPRRAALLAIGLGGIVIAAKSWVGVPGAIPSRQLRRSLEEWMDSVFGADISALPAAEAFLTDYEIAVTKQRRPFDQTSFATTFVLSTTLTQYIEQNGDLDYLGLYDPYELPCQNPLGAFYAPDGEHDA
jgi:hypothetical protein